MPNFSLAAFLLSRRSFLRLALDVFFGWAFFLLYVPLAEAEDAGLGTTALDIGEG